jgi:hypothetical protein
MHPCLMRPSRRLVLGVMRSATSPLLTRALATVLFVCSVVGPRILSRPPVADAGVGANLSPDEQPVFKFVRDELYPLFIHTDIYLECCLAKLLASPSIGMRRFGLEREDLMKLLGTCSLSHPGMYRRPYRAGLLMSTAWVL